MALREPFMVHTVEGATDLELTAGAGESLLVQAIAIEDPTLEYLTVTCARTTVGYFRVGGSQGNHLYFPEAALMFDNLLSFLIAMDLHRGFPVPEGETFLLSGAKKSTGIQAVMYQVFDAADQKPDSPNGPQARSFDFVNYGRAGAAVTEADIMLDTPTNPAEFPAFPFGEVSPSGRTVTLFGIAFSDVGKTSASQANQHETSYIKMIQDRQVLYDAERIGLLYRGDAATGADGTVVAGGFSVGGNRSDADLVVPLLFPAPLVFQGNEELNVYLSSELIAGSINLLAADCELAFIERVEG